MSPRNSLPQLTLLSPCQADWDSMIGNDRIRFCEHCQLSVHNQGALTEKQLRRLLFQKQGRLCVRFVEPVAVAAQPVIALYKIGRRASVIAAGAFTASLSFSTALAARVDLNRGGGPAVQAAVATTSLADMVLPTGGSIRGRVVDPMGAVIPGASVKLLQESGEVSTLTTDETGEFKFEGLKEGTYSLRIEAQGFTTSEVQNILLLDNDEKRIDQTLNVGGESAMAGAVAMSSPTEPLVKAANDDDIEAVQDRLLHGSDANVRDAATDMNPLECALRNSNREMMHVLLAAKADVDARDRNGQTILMLLGEEVTEDIVWDLLHAGAKVNARDNDGDTPLISAASTNNVLVLKVLLDAGAKVNATNTQGRTALMFAAEAGLVNNVKTLLTSGAYIDTRDKAGKTALMYAKEEGHQAVVRLLKSFSAADFDEPKQ